MTLSPTFRKLALVSASLAGLIGFVDAASANWASNHPRRVEVNDRLANQANRIAHQESLGNLTPSQAAHLLQEDYKIRQEERTMSGFNGSHITKQEQNTLNKQENKVSNQIP